MNTNKKTARLAGLLYFIMAIIAPFGIMYVPSQIMVWEDAAATANNILANEFLFRTGIVSDLAGQALFLLLAMVLYQLFKQVNAHQAKIMSVLVLVSIPISFLGDVFNITALMILKGGILESFEPEQIQGLIAMLLRTGSYGTQMVQLYWGLWLIPFGLLVYKSGFIPRILGVFLVINGIAYIVLSFTFLLFPDYRTIVFKLCMPFLFLGEIPIILWLLIKGVKTQVLASPKVIN
jgi:Domain of unknown function (DUF4386)